MKPKFISMKHSEYVNVYRRFKDILNPNRLEVGSGFVAQSANMDWHKLGLKYYETDALGKWFEVLDEKKWMQHLMLVKIAEGRIS